jgi:hypothetical protein
MLGFELRSRLGLQSGSAAVELIELRVPLGELSVVGSVGLVGLVPPWPGLGETHR